MAEFFVAIIRLLLNLRDIETAKFDMFRMVALLPVPMPVVLLFSTIFLTYRM
jgi:hypothetical protein